MGKLVELFGDLLSLAFFLQAFAGLTYLSLLPETFKEIANDFNFINFHFSSKSKLASKLLDFFNIDEDCDNAAIFLLNLLAVICIFSCILKFRVYQYIQYRYSCTCISDCKSYSLLDHPTLEIVGCLFCFYGLSLSAARSSVEECSGTGLRVIAVVILVLLLCGTLLVRYIITRACRGGIEPPSPLAEFASKTKATLYFRYAPIVVKLGNKNVFESSEDVTLSSASKWQHFEYWMKHLTPGCGGSQSTVMGGWEKPEVFSHLLRTAVNDPALVVTLDIGDVMALDFDIRKVVSLVGPRRTFALVALKLFRRNGLILDESKTDGSMRDVACWCTSSSFFRWVGAIEDGYFNHPYHNSVHATDVMCTSNSYLVHSGLHPRGGTNNSGFDDPAWQRAQFSLLVAAASHDIGHIGVSNAYLKAVGHPLSVEYADTVGILEAMHASTALAIFRQPGKNILECMSEGNGNQMREQIVELILVTDLSKQAGFLQEWMDRRTESTRQHVEGVPDEKAKWDIVMDGCSAKAHSDRMLFLKMMLKAADVSNPCKSTDLYLFWTNNILEEFYHQGDLEAARGLAVTKMPNCDRTAPSLAQGQIGFLCFVVKPLYDAIVLFLNDQPPPKRRSAMNMELTWGKDTSMNSLPRLELVMTNLNLNIEFWKRMSLTSEETAKVVFPRDLPTKYIEQSQRNMAWSVGDRLPETDELTNELQRQKVALHASRAQSWMDDISSTPAPDAPDTEKDALALEFERQRQGGKPKETHNPSMRERSAKKGEKFLDSYGILLLRFTPAGRHFYSNDMVRKLVVAILLASTHSEHSEHKSNMQVAFFLAITVAWLSYVLMDMPCCRLWASRAEALSAATLVLVVAVLFSFVYSTDSEQEVDTLSKVLYITVASSFTLQCLALATDASSSCQSSSTTSNPTSIATDREEMAIDLSTVYPESKEDVEAQTSLSNQATSDTSLVRRISSHSEQPSMPVSEGDDVIENIDTAISSGMGSRL